MSWTEIDGALMTMRMGDTLLVKECAKDAATAMLPELPHPVYEETLGYDTSTEFDEWVAEVGEAAIALYIARTKARGGRNG